MIKNIRIIKIFYEIYKKSDEDLVANNEQYLNKLRELQNRMEEELNENNQNIFF